MEAAKKFLSDYFACRQHIFESLSEYNPPVVANRDNLENFSQKLLDFCIFRFFYDHFSHCQVSLKDLLLRESSGASTLSEESAWRSLKTIFSPLSDLFGDISAVSGREQLIIPNKVFFQLDGLQNNNTLLYLSETYDFGDFSDPSRSITLTDLVFVFEKSVVTDLRLASDDDLNGSGGLSKRSRDGVFYTPTRISDYIVRETVGVVLASLKMDLGLYSGCDDGDSLPKLLQFRERLKNITILDPACGAGAFLIQAFKFLAAEHRRLAAEIALLDPDDDFDDPLMLRSIITNNLYGVDINPESAEATKVLLWLHTVSADCGFQMPDMNIQCGNSLVASDYYEFHSNVNATLSVEDVNTFDWADEFPEILSSSLPAADFGFDCVISNPPYVRIQHFKSRQPDVANYYLMAGLHETGFPLYESSQTGNFDLYLLFIEKGIELLNSRGKMGYITPTAWLGNKAGLGLRRKVKYLGCLERLVDFQCFQIFEGVSTYTGIQFFVGVRVDKVKFHNSPDGVLRAENWDDADSIPYFELSHFSGWHFIPLVERKLFQRLAWKFTTLAKSRYTKGVCLGVISGVDSIFINLLTADGKLLHVDKHNGGKKVLVDIEHDLLMPVLSGKQVKRYLLPTTNYRILQTYSLTPDGVDLIGFSDLEKSYPKTAAFLLTHKRTLCNRNISTEADLWHRFTRIPSNKCIMPKLLVAGTAPGLRVSIDVDGSFAALGSRVYSIFADSEINLFYLYGLLNSPLLDFLVRRTAAPKRGGYFSITAFVLSPLPIPLATEEEKIQVGDLAKDLQRLHTARINGVADDGVDDEIRRCEESMNALIYRLYDLTAEEIELVEGSFIFGGNEE